MKLKIVFSLAALVFCMASFAQINPKLTTNPKNMVLADTVAIKIKALQDENKKQQQENGQLQQQITELKTTLNSLATTLNFVSNNLNALQSNYNNFTTKVYPAHWHRLNGTAGNVVDDKNAVLVMYNSPAAGYLSAAQNQTSKEAMKESLKKTGPVEAGK